MKKRFTTLGNTNTKHVPDRRAMPRQAAFFQTYWAQLFEGWITLPTKKSLFSNNNNKWTSGQVCIKQTTLIIHYIVCYLLDSARCAQFDHTWSMIFENRTTFCCILIRKQFFTYKKQTLRRIAKNRETWHCTTCDLQGNCPLFYWESQKQKMKWGNTSVNDTRYISL